MHLSVIGEHGDSQVPLFSSAQVGGAPLRDFAGWNPSYEAELAQKVRGAAGEIIRRKGATNHAIGLATAHLLKWALRDEGRVLCVSRVQDGVLGLKNVALSLPACVGRNGASPVPLPRLDSAELAALQRSADVMREAKASLSAVG